MPNNRFLDKAQAVFHQMSEIRRDLHRHPELGMQEKRTSRIVADYLESLGLDVKRGIGGTGVVATLYSQYSQTEAATVCLRADMDALPMADKKNVPFASAVNGAAHCCGHDGHTAMLLGTANLLCDCSDSLKGNVKFIFQPSEEKIPGGALPMIKSGALKNPAVGGIFSLHLNPEFPEGTVAVKSGYCTISSAGFVLKMIGSGGHVARPQEAVDPIGMAAMVIMAGKTIVPTRVNPLDPAIVAFASVNGGTADNVIPEEVTLTGTIRTLKPEMRRKLAEILEETAWGVARISGGRCDLAVEMQYPSVFNHPQMVAEFRASVAQIVSPEKVIRLQAPSMTGEDVAYFHRNVPGVHWQLGIADPAKGFNHPLHSPFFDFNEQVMPLGAAIHAQCAVDYLINRAHGHLRWPWSH
jgi:amidohydrolase